MDSVETLQLAIVLPQPWFRYRWSNSSNIWSGYLPRHRVVRRSRPFLPPPPPKQKGRPLTSNIRCLCTLDSFGSRIYGLFVHRSVEPAPFAEYGHRSVKRICGQAATDISVAEAIPFLMLMGHAKEPLVLCEIETQSSRRKHANQASSELQFGLCLKSIGQILAENQVSHFLIPSTSDSLLYTVKQILLRLARYCW